MRLSAGDIVRGNHNLGHRYSSKPQPCSGKMASPRRDHAPAAIRNRAHEFGSARHHCDSIVIGGLTAFQLPHFRFRVKMRSNGANHFDCPDAMCDGHHLLFVNPLLASPDAPLALDRTSGINQNSIEIEENCGATKSRHSFFLTQRRLAVVAGRICGVGGGETACCACWRSCKCRWRKCALARPPQARTNQ